LTEAQYKPLFNYINKQLSRHANSSDPGEHTDA